MDPSGLRGANAEIVVDFRFWPSVLVFLALDSRGRVRRRPRGVGSDRPSVASYTLQFEVRQERSEVVGIAREDDLPEALCTDRDVTVDDVRRSRARQEKADAPGFDVVQRDDVDVWQTQKRGDPRLPGRPPPDLRHAACRDGDAVVSPPCLSDENGDRAIAAFERDQRAGVEDDALHVAPQRSWRARARSASVGRPPVRASISARSTSKSASAAS